MEQGCCEGSSAKGWTSSRCSIPPGFLGSCAFAMAQRACLPGPSSIPGEPGLLQPPVPIVLQMRFLQPWGHQAAGL